MIDPKDFLTATKPVETNLVPITGSFVCQFCTESSVSAFLDEDEMKIFYICQEGHKNEATL